MVGLKCSRGLFLLSVFATTFAELEDHFNIPEGWRMQVLIAASYLLFWSTLDILFLSRYNLTLSKERLSEQYSTPHEDHLHHEVPVS